MSGEEEENTAPDPFGGNDPFLTHAAGIDRPPPGRPKRTQPQPSVFSDICTTFGLIICPWLLFGGLSCLFIFVYHRHSDIVWITIFFLLVLSAISMTLTTSRKGVAILFIGLLCLVSTITGTVSGLYNYHENMFAYWSYEDNGVYTNLTPSEPAAAHKDAGKIFFSDAARVDTTKAVGYKDGPVYCVAPILDEVPIPKVQYWAVGQECCSQRADFNCDDSWNPKAHSAVVMLESNQLLPSHVDMYMKAVKLSEAVYDIVSVPDPIFVRWVAEPEVVEDEYWRSGIGFLVAAVSIYLLVSIFLGIIAHQSIKRARAAV
eukprot:gnl/MRDRNA2_/MRDRNA2_129480_c0_seq1.p1 gnl/MRDRNA2_/MRDRNA2_129480_c0~~gnl/MRDRNA2_/MRDRNA2_129480_c0_seq1.p1  ORF type:complete len:317 (+),score=33.66 gnl/MRDRNA2_/MRDRNA2_129480_c0_seq1:150-1100(+)